jgi:uncharacterized membrane protein
MIIMRQMKALSGAVVATAVIAAGVALPSQLAWTGEVGPRPLGTGAAQRELGGDARSMTPIFVLERNRLITFDIPFGEFGGDGVGINNRRQIVGGYADPSDGCLRGFLRDPDGRFTRIDVSAAGLTAPTRINDRGQVAGYYRSSPCTGDGQVRGFLRDERGGLTTIAVPGAVQTVALGLNNRGQVVGEYRDAGGRFHGYLWDKGRFTTIDGPDGATAANVYDINDRGDLVGVYADAAGGLHAYTASDGVYTTIDMPGIAFTIPYGINNRGQISGLTTAALTLPESPEVHGFLLRRGAGGPFTSIDVPGAAPGTAAFDVNDGGIVVGVYGNPDADGQRPVAGGSTDSMPGLSQP